MPRPRKLLVSQSLLVLIFVAMTTLSYPLTAAEADDGNWRIVNYWSEWCAPCRVEIPMLNELSVRLANSNVMIVGVNFDEDPRELTLEIADEMGIGFTVLCQKTVDLLGMKPPDVLPTTYLLSPSNEVMAKLIGMQSEQDIIEALTLQGLTPLTPFTPFTD
jgi:thiol-disulfide isomerase/thioredoxin